MRTCLLHMLVLFHLRVVTAFGWQKNKWYLKKTGWLLRPPGAILDHTCQRAIGSGDIKAFGPFPTMHPSDLERKRGANFRGRHWRRQMAKCLSMIQGAAAGACLCTRRPPSTYAQSAYAQRHARARTHAHARTHAPMHAHAHNRPAD